MHSAIDLPCRSPLDDPEWLADLDRAEGLCRRYLEDLRWPEGVCCPRCDCYAVGAIPARRRFYCRACKHHFSLTSGTVFHNSHLPIWKWFLAIELLLDGAMPANQLVGLLGGSYKTAWFVEHRIRAAIVQTGETPSESGIAGAYHRRLDAKYLRAYLAEASWRARNRGNPWAFHDTVSALLVAEPVPYDELVGAQGFLWKGGQVVLGSA